MGGGMNVVASLGFAFVVLLAFVVIYIRTQSPWILGALIAQAVSLVMRLGFFAYVVQDEAIRGTYLVVWQLAGLVMAACLLGYAINLPPLRRTGTTRESTDRGNHS